MRPPSRGFYLMPLWRRNLLCGTLGRSDKHVCMSFITYKVFLQNSTWAPGQHVGAACMWVAYWCCGLRA